MTAEQRGAVSVGRTESERSDLESLRRLALYSVVLALVVALLSSPAYFAAFGWDLEAAIFGDPSAILGGGASAAGLLRWGAIGDMFYSYLLLVPLALFLHRRLRPIKPWLADLATLGAFAYIFVGASAAAILASVGSSLIEAYATAPPAERVTIATSFGFLRDLVYFGVWQTLDPITAGTWVLGVGWLILPDRRVVGPFLVLLGAGLMALSVMTMLGIHSGALVLAGLGLVVALTAGWVVLARVRQSDRGTRALP